MLFQFKHYKSPNPNSNRNNVKMSVFSQTLHTIQITPVLDNNCDNRMYLNITKQNIDMKSGKSSHSDVKLENI